MSQTNVRFFELIRPNHNIDFVGKGKWFLWSSVLFVMLSLAFLPINRYVIKSRGQFLNFSIDFKGGSGLLIKFKKEAGPDAVKAALAAKGMSDAEVSTGERTTDLIVRFPTASALNGLQQSKLKAAIQDKWKDKLERQDYRDGDNVLYLWLGQKTDTAELKTVFDSVGVQPVFEKIKEEASSDGSFYYQIPLVDLEKQVRVAIEEKLGAGVIDSIPQVSSVGPKAGKDERDKGIFSLIAAIGFILLYILVRFDFRYGPGTVIALLHDAVLVLGAFAITYKEFSLTTIAAILTVIGYSMNDTIVVFDRIRENVSKHKDKKFRDVVNLSINETLSRTILTSMTVFFVTLAMNLLGSGVIRDFGFAMNVGVIVGTYSSIFIASPILIWLNERFGIKTSSSLRKK